jgi:energy-coupling factor transporter ATP-binding protein EcfA2
VVTKTTYIKRTRYFLSSKDTENIYKKLDEQGVTLAEHAVAKGVGKSTFQQVLNGVLPLTKEMYKKAFKDFGCIENIPLIFEK